MNEAQQPKYKQGDLVVVCYHADLTKCDATEPARHIVHTVCESMWDSTLQEYQYRLRALGGERPGWKEFQDEREALVQPAPRYEQVWLTADGQYAPCSPGAPAHPGVTERRLSLGELYEFSLKLLGDGIAKRVIVVPEQASITQ